MDIWSKEKRSDVMSRIRSRNTKPELAVRSMLHRIGFRFRLHRRNLPGCPDIVLPKYRAVIFVHGCFWHLHKGCKNCTIPKTQRKRWKTKLEGNVKRDKLNLMKLKELGWRTITLWECEVEKDNNGVKQKILKILKKTEDLEKAISGKHR